MEVCPFTHLIDAALNISKYCKDPKKYIFLVIYNLGTIYIWEYGILGSLFYSFITVLTCKQK